MNWQAKPRMTQIFFKNFYKLSCYSQITWFYFSRHPLILLCCAHTSNRAGFILHGSTTKCRAFSWSASVPWPVLVAIKRVFIIYPLICSHWDFLWGRRVISLTFFQEKVGQESLLLFCISILLPPQDISLSVLDTWFCDCSWSFGWGFGGFLLLFLVVCLFSFESLKAP